MIGEETQLLRSQVVETSKPSRAAGLPIVCIPGGPGLSYNTLAAQPLLDNFQIYMIKTPGTSDDADTDFSRLNSSGDQLYRKVNATICEAILECSAIERGFFLLGHSYGGIHAIDCAIRLARDKGVLVAGVILVSSPFTSRLYLDVIPRQINAFNSTELFARRKAYFDAPTRQSYQELLAAYNGLLIGRSREKGKQIINLLRTDLCCGAALASYAKSWRKPDATLPTDLQKLRIPAFGIFGEVDGLVPLEEARIECQEHGIEFVSIPDAGHFPFIDEPIAFAHTLTHWSRNQRI